MMIRLLIPTHRTWRLVRLTAASTTLGIQNSSPPITRSKYTAFLLTAGLVWFINGLHSRPEDGGSCDSLKCAIFPNTDDIEHPNLLVTRIHRRDHDDGSTGLPYCPGGVFFFRRIYWPPRSSTPRLGEGREISRRSWEYFFKKDYATLSQKIYPIGFSTETRNPSRIPARRGRTLVSANPPPEEPIFPDLNTIDLVPALDIADDIPLEEQIDGEDNLNPADTIAQLWLQSFSDFLQKIGAPKYPPNASSWCRLDMQARVHAKPELFESSNLGLVFTSVMWRRAAKDEWDQAFSMLWPDLNDIRKSSSQWRNLRYFQDWQLFIAGLPRDRVTKVRKSIKKRFNTLYWIPAPARDKIWDYREDSKYQVLPPRGQRGPHVLINYKRHEKPVFQPPITQEEEEEEEEEEEQQEQQDEQDEQEQAGEAGEAEEAEEAEEGEEGDNIHATHQHSPQQRARLLPSTSRHRTYNRYRSPIPQEEEEEEPEEYGTPHDVRTSSPESQGAQVDPSDLSYGSLFSEPNSLFDE
jgi:hypothetical protein